MLKTFLKLNEKSFYKFFQQYLMKRHIFILTPKSKIYLEICWRNKEYNCNDIIMGEKATWPTGEPARKDIAWNEDFHIITLPEIKDRFSAF